MLQKIQKKILIAALLAASSFAVSAEGLLNYGGHKGEVTVTRGTSSGALRKDTSLAERDVLVLAPDARVSLDISKHGFLEVGPASELTLERIPFATYADDLRTVFRLNKGYLRLVWRHPSLSTSWPMFVYLGNYRVSLTSGEYFFENDAGKFSLCVGGGEAALTSSAEPEPVTLDGPACYRLIPGLAPQLVERDYQELNSARSDFTLGTLADIAPPVVAAAPQADSRIPFTPTPAPAPVIAAAPAPAAESAPVVTPPRPVVSTPPPAPVAPPAPVVKAPVVEVEVPRPVVVYAPVEAPAIAPAPVAPKPKPAAPVVVAPKPVVAETPPPVVAAPAPVVTPAPRKPSAAATVKSGGWILNIASYPAKLDADAEARRLADAGYSPRVVEALAKGRTWYRVQLTGLESVQQAGELASKLGIKNAWVIR